MSDSSTTGVNDLSEDYPGQHITGPDTAPANKRSKRPAPRPPGAPAKGKGTTTSASAPHVVGTEAPTPENDPVGRFTVTKSAKGKAATRKATGKRKLASKSKAGKKPGKKPGGKGADYAARAAKIVASREANRKAGIGSVRVQRAFAKAMRKAAGL